MTGGNSVSSRYNLEKWFSNILHSAYLKVTFLNAEHNKNLTYFASHELETILLAKQNI
jgi:hypothetical protein